MYDVWGDWCRAARRVVAAAAVLAAVAGCTYENSPVDPNARITITGHVDGLAKGSTVALVPSGALSDFLTIAVPCPGCFGTGSHTTHLDGHGNYRFEVRGAETQTALGGLRHLDIYVRDDRPGITGTVARGGGLVGFEVRSDHVPLPALGLWRAAPTARVVGDDIVVAPPSPPSWMPGASVQVHLGDANGYVLASENADVGSVHFDARLLEDGPGRIWATASDGPGGTDRMVAGPTVAVVGALRPTSRGASCHTFTASGAARPLSPCGVTDGDLSDIDVVPDGAGQCVDLTPTAEAHCLQLTETVQIDLPTAADVHEIVVRTTVPRVVVQVSTDGRHFVLFGPAHPKLGEPASLDGPPPADIVTGFARAVVAVRVSGGASVSEVSVS